MGRLRRTNRKFRIWRLFRTMVRLMKITVEPKRESEKGLWYLKAGNEIIKRSFSKQKLLAIKQKLDEQIINIDDVRYQTILESDIVKWEEELE